MNSDQGHSDLFFQSLGCLLQPLALFTMCSLEFGRICWNVFSYWETSEWLFSHLLYIISWTSYKTGLGLRVWTLCACCAVLCNLSAFCVLEWLKTSVLEVVSLISVYCCCVCYTLCSFSFCFHHFEGVRWLMAPFRPVYCDLCSYFCESYYQPVCSSLLGSSVYARWSYLRCAFCCFNSHSFCSV